MYRRDRLATLASIVSFALLLVRCSSSETSLTAPTADKCQITATGSPTSFSADGGSGSVTISTSRDCTWSLATDANWVSISGNRDGQGEAVVPYGVARNPVPAGRSAAIVVGAVHVPLNQAAAPCVFDLNRSSDSIGAPGGGLTVTVTTISGCAWNATSAASWIIVVSGQNASATGAVGISVGANSGSQPRVGTVKIAGKTYTVTQDGVPPAAPTPPSSPVPPPSPSPPPSPAPPPPSPAPPPAPPPPPSGITSVDFSGSLSSLSGKCPTLKFTVTGHTVVTDKATSFTGWSCREIRNGRNVSVSGVIDSGGTVHATRIAKAGGD